MYNRVYLLESDDHVWLSEMADYMVRNIREQVHYIGYTDTQDEDDPCELSGRYFRPLVVAINSAVARTTILANGWYSNGCRGAQLIGAPRQRLLERAMLTVGGTVLVPEGASTAIRRSLALPPCVPIVETSPAVSPATLFDARLEPIQQLMQPGLTGPGSGAWRPGVSIVLMGDKPRAARIGDLKHRLPFFSLGDGGSALWLANELNEAKISDEYLYWVNSYDCYGEPTSTDFLEKLRPAAIVGLGGNAQRWVRGAKKKYGWLEHYEAHHPYKQKLSGSSEPYDLLAILRRLTTRHH